jgi:hypothetical protein
MQQETPQVGPPTLPPPSMPQQPPASQPVPPPQHQEQNFYQPSAAPATPAMSPSTPQLDDAPFSWEASEYIHIDKGSMWLIGLMVIVLIAAGIALLLHEWIFAVLIVVMGVTMGVFAFRPPHVLQYTLTNQGVQIANKLYPYKDYRAFGVLEDGAFYTMEFIPIKRFAPALSIYFAQPDGEHIVDIVGDHLPMEKVEPDLIDAIMRRLRF